MPSHSHLCVHCDRTWTHLDVTCDYCNVHDVSKYHDCAPHRAYLKRMRAMMFGEPARCVHGDPLPCVHDAWWTYGGSK
jgi:hypothetical protein